MATTLGKSALEALSHGLYTLLNVETLTATATGGYHNNLPPAPRFPYVRSELFETGVSSDANTMGRNGKEVVIRIHTFTQSGSYATAYQIVDKLVRLLNPSGNYRALTVTGYTTIHVWYEKTDVAEDDLIGGVKGEHLVSEFRWMGEEA